MVPPKKKSNWYLFAQVAAVIGVFWVTVVGPGFFIAKYMLRTEIKNAIEDSNLKIQSDIIRIKNTIIDYHGAEANRKLNSTTRSAINFNEFNYVDDNDNNSKGVDF